MHILEHIAQTSEELYWSVIEIFEAFLREPRPVSSTATERFPPDLEAALRALGRRSDGKGQDRFVIDLRGAWLSGASFVAPTSEGAFVPNFNGASFANAGLTNADFSRTNLQQVDFRYAKLARADFTYCDLRGSDLREADLTGANLTGAVMAAVDSATKVRSMEAKLDGANLTDANISQAIFLSRDQLRLAHVSDRGPA
ncbi:MAG: pentapeptide repeat-containing protein [Acidimicrobiales bacterium]